MHRNVHLLGTLGDNFGKDWSIDASSVGDMLKLISCQEGKFRPFLIQALDSGLDLAIVSGDNVVESSEELLLDNFGGENVYVALVPTGSGEGWGQIILGAILIIAGAYLNAAWGGAGGLGNALIGAGLGLAIQGITALLVDGPKKDKSKNGGIFNGPENTGEVGQPVPLLYGELLIGGMPIHVDLKKGASTKWTYSLPLGTNTNNFTATMTKSNVEELSEIQWDSVLGGVV